MQFVIIAALDEKTRGIGRGNGLPWDIYPDRVQFYHLTCGKVVVMGRKTYESLPSRPLCDRLNLVLTRQEEFVYHERGGVQGVFSLEDLYDQAWPCVQSTGEQQIMVIGGQEVFEFFLPKVDTLHLTLVSGPVPECDRFFPEYRDHFELDVQHGLAAKSGAYEYRFTTWKRMRH